MFNRFLLWIFNALIRFSLSKKMENEIQFIFRFSFSWRNWKTKYLNISLNRSRLTLWLFSQVCSTRNSGASSCEVPWGFPLYNDHSDTKNSLSRKQLMYFNVYIAGCYLHIWFILIVNCKIKHTSRSNHRGCSPKVISKVIP